MNIELQVIIFFLLSWGRWSEILEQGAFKRGWKENDVEDCSRIIVSIILYMKKLN